MHVQNRAKEKIQANLLFIDDLINGRLDDQSVPVESNCDLAGKEILSISPDGRYWTVGTRSSSRNEAKLFLDSLVMKFKSLFRVGSANDSNENLFFVK